VLHAAWIRMPLGMEVGLGSGDIVLDVELRTQLPPLKEAQQPPLFRPMSIVAKRLDGSGYHLVRR